MTARILVDLASIWWGVSELAQSVESSTTQVFEIGPKQVEKKLFEKSDFSTFLELGPTVGGSSFEGSLQKIVKGLEAYEGC